MWRITRTHRQGFTTATAGTTYSPPSNLNTPAEAGDVDVLFVQSESVISTPAGWTLPANGSRVAGHAAYAFVRRAAGGETVNVNLVAGQNGFAGAVSWVRIKGAAGLPAVAVSSSSDSLATGSGLLSTGALPARHGMVLAACMTMTGATGTPDPTNPAWEVDLRVRPVPGASGSVGASGPTQCTAFVGANFYVDSVSQDAAVGWTNAQLHRYFIALVFMPATPPQTIYTTQTPANFGDPGSITVGTTIQAKVPGRIIGIAWHTPPLPGTARAGLYSIAGNQLRAQDFGPLEPSQWCASLLYDPLGVGADNSYEAQADEYLVPAVYSSNPYTATAGVHSAGPITSGDLVAPQDGQPYINGRYVTGAAGGDLTFPTSTFGGNAYMADVLFEPGEVGPPEEPPAAENAIEAENRRAGTAKATWDVAGAGDPSIQGFATEMMVDRGGTLSVKVHSPASAWTGTVYRIGFYAGLGAREVATITGPQTTQPNGTTDPTTGMVSCANWTVNGTWQVPADATPGAYIIKIARDDDPSKASHIGPFAVRDPGRKAPLTVKLSDTTWQAYNWAGADPAAPFSGKSIYGVGTAQTWSWDQAARTRAVSYDRPLITRLHLSQTSFWNAEYPLIRWLERLGYDYDILPTTAVDADPSLLLGRQVVVSSGHDEYWSPRVRDAFEDARDAGVHLVFLSGNEAFWRINPSSPGARTYACWKDTHDGQLNPSGLYSGTWQDTRSFNSDRRPVTAINGQRFALNGISAYPLKANASHAGLPFWRDTPVAALTGAQEYATATGIVGFEADTPGTEAGQTPSPLVRLSEATYQVTGMLADVDGAHYDQSGTYVHAMTIYRASSGAAVFAAGTTQYAWALDENHDRHPGGSLAAQPLQQGLTNLLADLGVTPPAYPLPSSLAMPTAVNLTEYGLPDVDATTPAAPTNLAGTPTQTAVALTWTASTDNVAVTGYRVYRNAVQIAQLGAVTAYTATGLTPGTTYQWHVTALDAAGNESAASSVVAVATLPLPNTPPKAGLMWVRVTSPPRIGGTPS